MAREELNTKISAESLLTPTKNMGAHSAVHGSFWPVDIRKEEINNCIATIGKHTFEAQLWRLSPIGGEFLYLENEKLELKDGDKLSIKIRVGGRHVIFFLV